MIAGMSDAILPSATFSLTVNCAFLAAVKKVWGERVTTVRPRRGKFAIDPDVLASYPEADVTIDRTSDPLAFELPVLAAGHRRSPLLQR